jgi:hypothetical protein
MPHHPCGGETMTGNDEIAVQGDSVVPLGDLNGAGLEFIFCWLGSFGEA